MDPIQAVLVAIMIVKELRQSYGALREIPEEELVEIIKTNLIKISLAIETARKEMAEYGG